MNPQDLFCDKLTCPSRGRVGQGNIIGHGTKNGRQRYRCTTCGKTFVQTKGTPFYRRSTDRKTLTLCWTLLAWGCPPQAIVAAFGFDERTVYAWLEAAGQHCQSVHEHLVTGQPRNLEHVQADEIRVKGQKRQVFWMAMALCVPCRLWLGGVLSHSPDKALIAALAGQVKASALFGVLLLVSDGLAAYVHAWRQAFRTPVWTGKPGRPRLREWPILIGQVLKHKENGRVLGVLGRLVQGTRRQVQALVPEGQGLNTAYIERLNATFRARLCALVRRGRALAREQETLRAGMYLVGCVYNFCICHKSLRQEKPEGRRKWQPRTPAMAAGIAVHCWTVEELMAYRVPPAPYVPPRKRGRPPKNTGILVLAGCQR